MDGNKGFGGSFEGERGEEGCKVDFSIMAHMIAMRQRRMRVELRRWRWLWRKFSAPQWGESGGGGGW